MTTKVLNERYVIQDEITFHSWKAYDKESKEEVEIIIPNKQEYGPNKDLENELTIMSIVNHPNLINIKERFAAEGKDCFVTEYCKAGKIEDSPEFYKDENVAAGIFRQLISAVEYLHSIHIYHNNITLDSILLETPTKIKLSGFKNAQWMERCIKYYTTLDNHYINPSATPEAKCDYVKNDIWQCGVVLFKMVSGRYPFDEPSIRNQLKVIREGKYEMPDFSPELKDLISKMLNADPEARITIDEIKKHPWFMKGLESECELPQSPEAITCNGAVDISSVKPSHLLALSYLRFKKEEIEAQLSAEETTDAKIFLKLMEKVPFL